jgi:superfamily II DNA/RNA helicase
MSFDQLGLRAELLKAIKSKGYTSPTPVQTMAIPVILEGQDILARAQTGTGKTDAFALPIVEILSREKGKERHPRALVLTPTRELALQLGESINAYARRVSLVSRNEKVHLNAIEKLINQKIPVEKVAGYTEGSELMDFLSPGSKNAQRDKEVEKAVKEYAARKKAQKQKPDKSKTKTKDSGKSSRPESKKRSSRKSSKTGKTPSPSGSRSRQSLKQGKPGKVTKRGKRS